MLKKSPSQIKFGVGFTVCCDNDPVKKLIYDKSGEYVHVYTCVIIGRCTWPIWKRNQDDERC